MFRVEGIRNSKHGFLNFSAPENQLENIFEMQILGSTQEIQLCGSASSIFNKLSNQESWRILTA